MCWKRFAHAFLCGIGCSVFGVGCAVVDAIVSSPAGNGATSPERVAAIGRVFENQGHYLQAQAMYRQALKADPSNEHARDRLQYLASRTSSRDFDASTKQTEAAIALADSIETQKKDAKGETPSVVRIEDTLPLTKQNENDELEEALNNDAVVASLSTDISEPLIESESAENDVDEQIPGTLELADLSQEAEEDEPTQLVFAPAAKVHTPSVITPESDDAETDLADVSVWKATERNVALSELLEWLETPVESENNLLLALRCGEDAGVKALAASALASCPLTSQVVNAALRDACKSENNLVKLTALESLTERGALAEAEIEELLTLVACDDSDIRLQAAGSLRNLAGTQWSDACVTGLTQLLHDEEPSVVSMAATTLGDFGSAAVSARSTIQQVRFDRADELTIQSIEHALRRIPNEEPFETSPTLRPLNFRSQQDESAPLPVAE